MAFRGIKTIFLTTYLEKQYKWILISKVIEENALNNQELIQLGLKATTMLIYALYVFS